MGLLNALPPRDGNLKAASQIMALPTPSTVLGRVTATYPYTDEDGKLIFRVERLEPKSFRQSRPDGRDGWVYNLEGVRRVPYRARELVRALANGLTVAIVEGEKDADRVADLGLAATTFAGGTSGWREDYGEWFVDANVVVIPDNDPPGAKYAATIAQSLAGMARSVRILELPDLPPKGDVSDWIDAGGTGAKLERLFAEAAVGEAIDRRRDQPTPKRSMRAKRASEIAPTRVEWIWPIWLPAARLALFGGKPGDGKSGVSIDLAARLSMGSPLPDGYRPLGPLTVLILSGEDDPSDTLVPRLIAAGANLERIVIANGTVIDNETGMAKPWTLPADVDVLGQLVRKHHVDVAVLDPLGAFVSTTVDTHRDSAVRAMLLPLAQMARRERCAVLGIRHHRKGGAVDARDAGSGSVAFTAAARIEWVAGRDPQDPTRRILAVSKTNIGKEPTSLAYRLVDAEGEWDTLRIAWDGTSALTANQLVGEPVSEEDRSELEEAIDFLSEALADGPRAAKPIKRLADQAGIAERTLRRAKERLGVKTRKTSAGPWEWQLREGGQPQDEDGYVAGGPHLGHVGPLGRLPSSTTYNKRASSRESLEGGQGGQGYAFGSNGQLPCANNDPPDGFDPFDDRAEDLERAALDDAPPRTDDDLERWTAEVETEVW